MDYAFGGAFGGFAVEDAGCKLQDAGRESDWPSTGC